MVSIPRRKANLIEFLKCELELSYERNKEVGGYQKGTMNLLFSFYGLIIGAIVFKGGDSGEYLNQLNSFKYLIPILVLLVGLAFSVMYFNYEVYTKVYKKCMSNLEDAIYDMLFHHGSNFMTYKITYYAHPKGHPQFVKTHLYFDAGFIFAMSIMIIMNHGIAILVLHLIGEFLQQVAWWVIVSLLIHMVVLVYFYLYQRKKWRPHNNDTSSKSSKEKRVE